jgi:hypothetical protein
MNRSFVQHSDSSELVHAMSVGGREAPLRMEPLPTTQTVALRSTRSLRNWALWVLAPILQRRREFLTADGTDFTDEGEDETVAIGVLLPWLKLSAGQYALIHFFACAPFPPCETFSKLVSRVTVFGLIFGLGEPILCPVTVFVRRHDAEKK